MSRLVPLSGAVVVAAAVVASAAGHSEPAAPTVRFAVTLNADVDTTLEYAFVDRRDDGCTYFQSGRASRLAHVMTAAPTIIRVRGGKRPAYAPSVVRSVRLRMRDYAGDVMTRVTCPDGPTSSNMRACDPFEAVITTQAIPRARFHRTTAGRIAWSRLAHPPITPCGLEDAVGAGWLHLATGAVDERALFAARRRVVRVRGGGRVADFVIPTTGGPQIRRTIWIGWTLTFRRLSEPGPRAPTRRGTI